MRLIGIIICLLGVGLSGSHEAEALAQWPSHYIYIRDGSKKRADPLIKVDESYIIFGITDRRGRIFEDKVARSEVDLICFNTDCEWVLEKNFSKDLLVWRDGRRTLGHISSVVGGLSNLITQNNSQFRLDNIMYIKFAVESPSVRSPSASIKQTRVLGFNAEGRKVYDSPRIQGDILYWPWSEKKKAWHRPGTYFLLYEIERSYDHGAKSMVFSKLTSGRNWPFLGELKAGASPQQQTEFFNLVLQELPQASELWLRYAASLQNQWRYPRPVRLNSQVVNDMDVDHEKLKANLPTALAALQKAVELANDCETKGNAMEQLSLVYGDAGEMGKSREWALNKAKLPCAKSKFENKRHTEVIRIEGSSFGRQPRRLSFDRG